MRDEAFSDVLKVWLYAVATVLLGAWISPLLYNAGKALAEVSAAKRTNSLLEWLAGQCRVMDFPAFFQLSILGVAAVLFIPMAEWLRGGRTAESGKISGLRLPDGARNVTHGQRLVKNPRGPMQAVAGFLGVCSVFFALSGILVLTGTFEVNALREPVLNLLLKVLTASVAWAAVQEFFFRGVAMGIFLRAMRPAAALGLSALLFAIVHFLNPPPGLNVLDPDAAGVGFELLRKIVRQFSELKMIGTLAPLLALGGMLAFARWKTASLWLPIGLHAGWIFVNAVLTSFTVGASRPDSLVWIFSGTTFKQGLVPLAGILIAGAIIVRLTTPPDAPETAA